MGSSTKVEAPKPDPLIGQSALLQSQLGRESLDFAKQQFAAGEKRQDAYDILANRVADSALASQAKTEQWAQQDRDMGQKQQAYLDTIADKATADGEQFGSLFLKMAGEQTSFGAEELARYQSTFRPVQDRIVSDAMGWDSEDRLASESGKAKADVMAGAAQAREASAREMAAMGIDPRSGRFAGVDRATGLQTALAGAGAANMARDGVQMQAQTLRGQAAQLGQQVLANGQQANQMGMAATNAAQTAKQSGQQLAMQAKSGGLAASGAGLASMGMGLSAGGAATGAGGAANANFNANNGIMFQGLSGAMQGAAGAAGTMNNLYGNQLQGWSTQMKANASKSNGIGSLLGSLAGTGAQIFL